MKNEEHQLARKLLWQKALLTKRVTMKEVREVESDFQARTLLIRCLRKVEVEVVDGDG